jgi:outer membrane protein FlgP
MKFSLILALMISVSSALFADKPAEAKSVTTPPVSTVNVVCPDKSKMDVDGQEQVLESNKDLIIGVVGQGVAPMNTTSPAQAYALAKRAAIADAYRMIAEKVKGVRVDGQDLIKNMMVKRSTIRTAVNAMVRNANIVETTFKEGLCEVEMEIVLSHSQFAQ